MSSTFAKIVRAQRLDRKDPAHRAFAAKAITTLAHRARTNTLRGPVKLTLWQRFRRFLYRLRRGRMV